MSIVVADLEYINRAYNTLRNDSSSKSSAKFRIATICKLYQIQLLNLLIQKVLHYIVYFLTHLKLCLAVTLVTHTSKWILKHTHILSCRVLRHVKDLATNLRTE